MVITTFSRVSVFFLVCFPIYFSFFLICFIFSSSYTSFISVSFSVLFFLLFVFIFLFLGIGVYPSCISTFAFVFHLLNLCDGWVSEWQDQCKDEESLLSIQVRVTGAVCKAFPCSLILETVYLTQTLNKPSSQVPLLTYRGGGVFNQVMLRYWPIWQI